MVDEGLDLDRLLRSELLSLLEAGSDRGRDRGGPHLLDWLRLLRLLLEECRLLLWLLSPESLLESELRPGHLRHLLEAHRHRGRRGGRPHWDGVGEVKALEELGRGWGRSGLEPLSGGQRSGGGRWWAGTALHLSRSGRHHSPAGREGPEPVGGPWSVLRLLGRGRAASTIDTDPPPVSPLPGPGVDSLLLVIVLVHLSDGRLHVLSQILLSGRLSLLSLLLLVGGGEERLEGGGGLGQEEDPGGGLLGSADDSLSQLVPQRKSSWQSSLSRHFLDLRLGGS